MDEVLTRETFDPHVGKTFRVSNGHHALMLVRIETRPIEEWERKMGLRAPFNLIFRGPAGDVLRSVCQSGAHVGARPAGLSVLVQLTHQLQFRDGKIPCSAMEKFSVR
jgi:hypothetical protein